MTSTARSSVDLEKAAGKVSRRKASSLRLVTTMSTGNSSYASSAHESSKTHHSSAVRPNDVVTLTSSRGIISVSPSPTLPAYQQSNSSSFGVQECVSISSSSSSSSVVGGGTPAGLKGLRTVGVLSPTDNGGSAVWERPGRAQRESSPLSSMARRSSKSNLPTALNPISRSSLPVSSILASSPAMNTDGSFHGVPSTPPFPRPQTCNGRLAGHLENSSSNLAQTTQPPHRTGGRSSSTTHNTIGASSHPPMVTRQANHSTTPAQKRHGVNTLITFQPSDQVLHVTKSMATFTPSTMGPSTAGSFSPMPGAGEFSPSPTSPFFRRTQVEFTEEVEKGEGGLPVFSQQSSGSPNSLTGDSCHSGAEGPKSRTDTASSRLGVSSKLGTSKLFFNPCFVCSREITDEESIFRCEDCNYIECNACHSLSAEEQKEVRAKTKRKRTLSFQCSSDDDQSTDEEADSSVTSTSSHTHKLKSFKWRMTATDVPKSMVSNKTTTIEGNNIINDYVVVKLLGRGSFAKVKLVQHIHTGELYALKILKKFRKSRNSFSSAHRRRPSSTTDTQIHDDLLREIAVMKLVEHPNIVKLKEVIDDVEEESIYIIMEYCEGGPIHILGDLPLPVEDVRRYGSELASALLYLHSEFLYHRDVKPANVLVANGVAKLVDFGTCNSCIKTSLADGTPAFSCPEQVRGQEVNGEVVDSWAFAMTLFQMAYGKLPFSSNLNAFTLRQSLMNDVALDIPDYPGDTGLQNLLQEMLCKDLSQRLLLSSVVDHDFFSAVGPEMGNVSIISRSTTIMIQMAGVSITDPNNPAGTSTASLLDRAMGTVQRGRNLKETLYGVHNKVRRASVLQRGASVVPHGITFDDSLTALYQPSSTNALSTPGSHGAVVEQSSGGMELINMMSHREILSGVPVVSNDDSLFSLFDYMNGENLVPTAVSGDGAMATAATEAGFSSLSPEPSEKLKRCTLDDAPPAVLPHLNLKRLQESVSLSREESVSLSLQEEIPCVELPTVRHKEESPSTSDPQTPLQVSPPTVSEAAGRSPRVGRSRLSLKEASGPAEAESLPPRSGSSEQLTLAKSQRRRRLGVQTFPSSSSQSLRSTNQYRWSTASPKLSAIEFVPVQRNSTITPHINEKQRQPSTYRKTSSRSQPTLSSSTTASLQRSTTAMRTDRLGSSIGSSRESSSPHSTSSRTHPIMTSFSSSSHKQKGILGMLGVKLKPTKAVAHDILSASVRSGRSSHSTTVVPTAEDHIWSEAIRLVLKRVDSANGAPQHPLAKDNPVTDSEEMLEDEAVGRSCGNSSVTSNYQSKSGLFSLSSRTMVGKTSCSALPSSLVCLSLSRRHLRTVSQQLTSLSNTLNVLDLAYNTLTGLPPFINWSSFHHLTIVELHHNQFRQFPEAMLDAPRLTSLDLSYNLIENLPEASLQLCTELEELMLRHNRIRSVGVDPSTGLSALSHAPLRLVDLSENPLEALPPHLDRSKKLQLILDANPLLQRQWENVLCLHQRGAGASTPATLSPKTSEHPANSETETPRPVHSSKDAATVRAFLGSACSPSWPTMPRVPSSITLSPTIAPARGLLFPHSSNFPYGQNSVSVRNSNSVDYQPHNGFCFARNDYSRRGSVSLMGYSLPQHPNPSTAMIAMVVLWKKIVPLCVYHPARRGSFSRAAVEPHSDHHDDTRRTSLPTCGSIWVGTRPLALYRSSALKSCGIHYAVLLKQQHPHFPSGAYTSSDLANHLSARETAVGAMGGPPLPSLVGKNGRTLITTYFFVDIAAMMESPKRRCAMAKEYRQFLEDTVGKSPHGGLCLFLSPRQLGVEHGLLWSDSQAVPSAGDGPHGSGSYQMSFGDRHSASLSSFSGTVDAAVRTQHPLAQPLESAPSGPLSSHSAKPERYRRVSLASETSFYVEDFQRTQEMILEATCAMLREAVGPEQSQKSVEMARLYL